MMGFKQWLDANDLREAEAIVSCRDRNHPDFQVAGSMSDQNCAPRKPRKKDARRKNESADDVWEAKPSDVLAMWQSLRPSPLDPRPVPADHVGRRTDEDGFRITGRPEWIGSVLFRLREMLAFENQPGLKLDIAYRQIQAFDQDGDEGEPRFSCRVLVVADPGKAPAGLTSQPR